MVVTNTDDFLVRMLKGCVQLSARPRIENTVNSVPVDHVARTVVGSAFFPPEKPLGLVHVTSHPRLRFCDILATLEEYGYQVPEVDYSSWRTRLEEYVANEDGKHQEPHALLPLYHFATTDLPEDTKAPEMDDANATKVLKQDAQFTGQDVSGGAGVTVELMGVYLAYLVRIGFLPEPSKAQGKTLPKIKISEEQRNSQRRAGGRAVLG